MSFILQPWHLLFAAMAGALNRHQDAEIEYVRTQNQVWKELYGKRPIRLNDDQRRRLAVKGKTLGLRRLKDISTIFTPETILRWHRRFVAAKWDCSALRRKPPGRPPVS